MTVSEDGEAAWPKLRTLADMGFDLKRWGEAVRRSGPGAISGPFIKDLGDIVDTLNADGTSFIPSEPFIRGYQAALRDAWETAERPEASDAPGGNTDTGDGEEVAAPAM